MRITKFIISFILTVGLVYFLNNPIPQKGRAIPPIAKLLNPFTGFWNNAEKVFTNENKAFHFDALSEEVKVVYDQQLVPHIFAKTLQDAMFVQGYITAKHRLWQMDIATRATSGRLSEVMGSTTLKRDKMQRRKGLVFAAKNTLAVWQQSTEDFKNLESYTAGVNAYIEQLSPRDYPLEFKLLDYKPEAWTNLKSAIFMKSMAETLCSRESDLEATNALAIFGQETFDFLYPLENPKQSPIIPSNTTWDFEPVELNQTQPSMLGLFKHQPFKKPSPFLGSNNWAVAGSKTKSGNPILCNDPHLGLTLPAIWFEIQIHTPEGNTYGVSLPGLPGIIIGFNEYIAFGMTNVGHDVLDYFRINWADDSREKYVLDNDIKTVRYQYETIKVKDQADVIDTVKYTQWGPILYEDPKHPMKDLAMKWLAHDGGSNELSTFRKMNKAKSFEGYYDAVQSFEAPPQNVVFACTDGDIAIKVQGKFPLKRKNQGRFIMDGSSTDNGWQGFIPKAHNPQSRNPERGYVSSANQHSTDSSYPYNYHGGFEDFRGRALNHFLDSMNNIVVEDMMNLQNNNFSHKAADALPLLLANLSFQPKDDTERKLIDDLKNWNYYFDKELVSPVLFDEWFDEFYWLTWDEIKHKQDSLGVKVMYPESWRTIALLEEMPDHSFFDLRATPSTETAKDLVNQAFEKALNNIKEKLEKDPDFNLQKHKKTHIPHLGRIEAFGSDFLNVGGDGSALNAIRNTFGPSWRMIVEMSKPVKAYAVYPGGQSGNPGSPYYDNMVEHWINGKYYEKLFLKAPEEIGEALLFSESYQ